jgi:hypothetical protein
VLALSFGAFRFINYITLAKSSAANKRLIQDSVLTFSIIPCILSLNKQYLSFKENVDYDNLTKEQQELWDKAYEEGYELGFGSGLEASAEEYDGWEDGYGEGFRKGIETEQNRIQFVLKMMFDAALNMSQGNKAVQYKQMIDLLAGSGYTYDEAKYYEDLRNDGI